MSTPHPIPNTHPAWGILNHRRLISLVAALLSLLCFVTSAVAQPIIVTTISFGSSRAGVIGVNPSTNRIYAAQEDAHALAVIDGATNAILTTVPTAGYHTGVAINPTTNRIYVGQQFAGSVRIIDSATNAVLMDLPVPGLVHTIGDLAINPATNRLYVIRSNNGDVAVFDAGTNSFLAAFPGGTAPTGIAVNPLTNRIYVASGPTNGVKVIDGVSNNVITTISVGNNPSKVGVNTLTNRIYVSNANDNTVSVIDGTTNTVMATVSVGTLPTGVAVNPNTNRIYVANVVGNSVAVIDGANNTVASTLSVASQPGFVALNPTTSRIYVAHDGAHAVSVIEDVVTHLTMNLANPSVAVGASKTINIDLNNAANLYGYQFQVSYDASKVNASATFVNSWFDTTSNAVVPNGWNAACSSGVCKFAASKQSPATALTGSGTLAQITFTGVAAGVSPVTFGGDILGNRNGGALVHSIGNGTLTVYGTGTIAGQVNMQGRAAPSDTTGTVMMIDHSGYFPTSIVSFDALGAFTASVPALAGGTTYDLFASHGLYLSNQRINLTTVTPGNTTNVPATLLLGGDADNSGLIDVSDLSCIGGAFGGAPVVCGTTGSTDINKDTTTNILDLVLAGGNYGLSSPQPW